MLLPTASVDGSTGDIGEYTNFVSSSLCSSSSSDMMMTLSDDDDAAAGCIHGLSHRDFVKLRIL